MGKTFADPFGRNFHAGGSSPFCRPPAAGHAVTCFSSQWESLAENSNRFVQWITQHQGGGNPAKLLKNRAFQVTNPYLKEMA